MAAAAVAGSNIWDGLGVGGSHSYGGSRHCGHCGHGLGTRVSPDTAREEERLLEVRSQRLRVYADYLRALHEMWSQQRNPVAV